MAVAEAEAKKKTVIYLPGDLDRRLWQGRIETKVPVTRQIEKILSDHFRRKDQASSRAKPSAV